MTLLHQVDTPYLLIDKNKYLANINRAKTAITENDGVLRPHLKTVKSIDAAKYLSNNGESPVTVSTLHEAEVFANNGYKNMIYAVGIAPKKLNRVHNIQQKGTDISILLDSVEQAKEVSNFCETSNCDIPVYIEIDCDDHRGGIKPEDPLLLTIANILQQSNVTLKGILTHAGESYNCTSKKELSQAAENERIIAIKAAMKLRENGFSCPEVSIGSTPTALSYSNLDGITDVRAGVFAFFDLVMAGIGVCKVSDIALSVVTTVIGYNKERNWLFIDAGWMALSRDRGTQHQTNDCGYGLVCDENGKVLQNLQVKSVNQEHGIITCIDEQSLSDLSIGTTLHILPNHACATASMHSGYYVKEDNLNTLDYWPRIQGWN